MQSKGKLIWSSAEAKLKTMRAAALTLSLAFSWGSSKAESLENSEGGTCTYVQQALSRQPRKGAQKSVRGSHAFLLLTAVPRQQKRFGLGSLARCRSLNRCICNMQNMKYVKHPKESVLPDGLGLN
jgi:hypothetical protein